LSGNAGSVVSAFGEFVVGGNVVVGLVVFIIITIVQFVVITKGAERIAEVAARFTLDAMPGKQMSIDADLSAGLITNEEARRRRREVEDEADFYGAMESLKICQRERHCRNNNNIYKHSWRHGYGIFKGRDVPA
jgi:flagellar biosynthesis protein FlhA